MERKLYYIHGLHGSNQSKKYLELKEYYPEIECLSWEVTDDINLKLQDWKQIINENSADVDCIIASSTGANFAYQLRKICKPNYFHLVLINPLFDFDDKFDSSTMPEQLKKYLVKIEKHSESLILLSKNDTVINNQKYLLNDSFIKNHNHIVIDDNATHRFENIKNYFKLIDDTIHSIY